MNNPAWWAMVVVIAMMLTVKWWIAAIEGALRLVGLRPAGFVPHPIAVGLAFALPTVVAFCVWLLMSWTLG